MPGTPATGGSSYPPSPTLEYSDDFGNSDIQYSPQGVVGGRAGSFGSPQAGQTGMMGRPPAGGYPPR